MRLEARTLLSILALSLCALSACEDDGPAGPDPLTAPANVQATALSPNAVRVTFAPVAGAQSYTVQRAVSGGSFANAGTATTTTYEDSGLEPGTEYRYRVAAVRGAETGPYSDIVTVATPPEGAKVATISSDITSDRTLYADTVYKISGFVKVTNGATLRIQPGTTILGDYNTVGSSLFVLRGAKIIAEGTADTPIVFTSSRPVGERRPGDWGGLIIVGNARINRTHPVQLEGTGTDNETNPPVLYSGGTDDEDDSGVLRYVRIEFAGYATAPNAELNSLTLAAVGSGTTIEYVQALAGLDDSFEWFGGTVDAKYLVSYEAGDDHFDASEGYRGRVQYMIAFQSKVLEPRPGAGGVGSDPQGIENDGCDGANCPDGQDSQPYTTPLFANFTLVGTGPGVVDQTSGGIGMLIRRGAGGTYVNGVMARWPRAAISLRDATTQARAASGDLALRNILVADNAVTCQPQSGSTVQFCVDLAANAIEERSDAAATLFSSLPTDPSGPAQLDWTPPPGSPAATGGLETFPPAIAAKAGAFVTPTAFRGAADPNGPKWWQGWTNYADH